jgi:hypothetical protein
MRCRVGKDARAGEGLGVRSRDVYWPASQRATWGVYRMASAPESVKLAA